MFADFDEALRQLLVREVPLPPSDIDVAFERPDRERVARFSRPTVDLFLFDLAENKDQVDTGWQAGRNADGSATLRWPPLRVDLHYVITVWAQNIEDEHQLLYHLYRTLRRFPELPDDLRSGALERQPRPILLDLSEGMEQLRALLDLWGVLDNAMRPGLVLKATVAVDLNGAREAPLVRTTTTRIGAIGRPPETRNRINGRLRDPAGAPIAGGRVRAHDGRRTSLSNADGAYSLDALTGPSVDIDVDVEAPGYAPQSLSLTLPGDYDVTLTPRPDADVDAGPSRPRRGGGGGGA